MTQTGIYSIRNLANGKIYIGSAVNIRGRWATHQHYLETGKHDNNHLQRAWRIYGKEIFEFAVVELCSVNMLLVREQAWIDYYDAANDEKGYNIAKVAGSQLGFKMSEEVVAARRGKPLSEETKRKISIAKKGKPQSEETRKKIAEGHLGKKHSEETRKKMSAAQKGKHGQPKSEEWKAKQSQMMKGNKIACKKKEKAKVYN